MERKIPSPGKIVDLHACVVGGLAEGSEKGEAAMSVGPAADVGGSATVAASRGGGGGMVCSCNRSASTQDRQNVARIFSVGSWYSLPIRGPPGQGGLAAMGGRSAAKRVDLEGPRAEEGAVLPTAWSSGPGHEEATSRLATNVREPFRAVQEGRWDETKVWCCRSCSSVGLRA